MQESEGSSGAGEEEEKRIGSYDWEKHGVNGPF